MDYVAISGLTTSFCGLICALFIFYSLPRTLTKKIWSIYSLSMGFWGFGLFMSFSSSTSDKALFWAKFLNTSAILIPVLFFYFALLLINKNSQYKKELFIYILISLIFFLLAIAFNNHFVKSVNAKMNFKFYPSSGLLYYFFPIQFGYLVVRTILILIKEYIKSTGLRKEQLKYVLIGSIIGFSGGGTTFPLVFNIEVYPFGVIQVPIYLSIITYAVIKYRLMDIRLAITRAGIFICVYTLILGIPFGLTAIGKDWLIKVLGPNWHWAPMLLLVLLATVGPFVYLYIQRKAEKRLLAEQHQYQHSLRQAAIGMSRIKDLKRLTNLIVYIITRTVRIKHASIYIIDKDTNKYILKATKGESTDNKAKTALDKNTPLIDYLKKYQDPILYEEIKQKAQNLHHKNIENVALNIEELDAELAIPCIVDNKLIAFVVLGKKRLNKIYNQDDLVVFSILGSHAALAIENCQYFDAEKQRLKQEGARARRESMDMLVSTMAHEIDNPITSVIGNVDIIREYLETTKDTIPQKTYDEINHAIGYVQRDASRVSKIIKAVEDYSKGGEGELKPISIYDVLEPYRTLLILVKKKVKGVNYTEEIEDNLPPVLAEQIILEEILINYAENAFHAVQHNEDKKVKLRIFSNNNKLRIEVSDNGYGILSKVKKQLFEVPTTTKGSSEGTGIGLYRIRQICTILNADYGAESEGENAGSCFYVEIPFTEGSS